MSVATGRLVYVVDDDEAVRESTAALLEAEGLAARTCATAKDFLAEFDVAKAGCLIFDVHMPEMSGIELLAVLRARRIATPAIVLTGRRDPMLDEMARRAGALALIDKPPADDVLLTLVKRALGT